MKVSVILTFLFLLSFPGILLQSLNSQENSNGNADSDYDENFLLMQPIREAFKTGDIGKLTDYIDGKRISVNFESPFDLNGYYYLDKFKYDFTRKFSQYTTLSIEGYSKQLEEDFSVQSFNWVLKHQLTGKTVHFKLIFFLKKIKGPDPLNKVNKDQWKIYHLRGLRI